MPHIYHRLKPTTMKAKLLRVVMPILLVFTMMSCSSEESESGSTNSKVVTEYSYDQDEMALVDVVNNYRVSQGLSALTLINHISYKSEEHNDYMIENNVVNHDYFNQRASNIKSVLGAVTVGENIAYNFSTPNSALHAWLQSPGHKENIEGDYTHFGVSISINPANGKKYYTNIFMKK